MPGDEYMCALHINVSGSVHSTGPHRNESTALFAVGHQQGEAGTMFSAELFTHRNIYLIKHDLSQFNS